MAGMTAVLAGLLVVLAAGGHGVQARERDSYRDLLFKDYCRVRPGQQCCPGRDDTCTMPILNTVCYCDMFCNRTITDCCPDFWGHCIGIRPPVEWRPPTPDVQPATKPKEVVKEPNESDNCVHGNKIYIPGNMITVNCNNCTCVMAPGGTEYNWKCTQKICVVREELLERANQGNYGWKASNYSIFWGMTLDDAAVYRLGTERPVEPVKQMTSLRVHINDILPAEFDSRVEWPGLIHPIQDQGDCGSSWAVSTTSVAADRLTIHSNGYLKDLLSAQNLVSCNRDYLQKGCRGGHLDRAWWYLRRVGVVSEQCYPYKSGHTNTPGKCLVPPYTSLRSRTKCPSGAARKSLVYQATPPYRIAPIEREIMKEIMENGPVQATMEVKEDFYLYRGGVYSYSLPGNYMPPNHRKTGFHSVRIIGWGTDYSQGRPLKYWLCANSWGPKWGENGYFRIIRGQDECKIESFVVGVWGKVNGRQITRRRSSSRFNRQGDQPKKTHHHHKHHGHKKLRHHYHDNKGKAKH